MGHYLTGYFLKMKVKEIRLYMFGGITVLNEDLNLDIKKEILMLIMGPITQMLFFILIYFLHKEGYVNSLTYTKIKTINNLLISFNLLPILPLDGGKLLNNILDLIFPYKLSHLISIIISIIFLPTILLIDNKLLSILLITFLSFKLYIEISNHKYILNKLILERNLKNYHYKKTKTITNINKIKRGENYILIN